MGEKKEVGSPHDYIKRSISRRKETCVWQNYRTFRRQYKRGIFMTPRGGQDLTCYAKQKPLRERLVNSTSIN